MQTCRAGADLTSEPLGSLAVSPAAAINDKSEETSHGDGDVLMAAYSNAPSYHLFLAILTAWPCTSILQSLLPIVAGIVRKSLGPAQACVYSRRCFSLRRSIFLEARPTTHTEDPPPRRWVSSGALSPFQLDNENGNKDAAVRPERRAPMSFA
jgi:hypothetical protein